MAKRLYDPYLHKVVDESPADPASKLMYDTALCRLRFVDTTFGDRVYDPLMKKFRLGALLNQAGYTDAEITAMIADGYVPIASADDLNAIRAVQTDRVFAAGTKWETTVTTLGLAGKYLQVADIDLYTATRPGGEFSVSTRGWAPLGGTSTTNPFYGIYDGAGFIIYGLYSTYLRPSLFGYTGKSGFSCRILNVNCSNAEIYGYYNSALTGANIIASRAYYDTEIYNCQTSGSVIGGNESSSICGYLLNGAKVYDCFSSANLDVLSSSGGIVGAVATGSNVNSSIFVGLLKNTSGGSVIGVSTGGTVTNSYYNSDTLGSVPVGGRGIGLTMSQLLVGDSTNYLLGYDTSIWRFINGKYPILRMLGEMPGNKQPVQNLTSEIVADDIVLTWDAASGATGYNVYLDVAGVVTKVNAELITELTYNYTPADSGEYKLFVRAVYEIRGFSDEGGNSISITEPFFFNGVG